jgi:hypothetical protein
MKAVWLLFCAGAGVCLPGCGGEAAPARSADDAPGETPLREAPLPSTSAEIGALDEGKVTQTFKGATGALQKCLKDGSDRNELEGGDIAFFVKIGTDGRAFHVHAEKSTIGDRETEKCMFSVLKGKDWPAPQGGDVGLARNSYGFDMENDERPPTDWTPDRVEDTVAELGEKITVCKGDAKGKLSATVYVDASGAATSVGIASADESGEKAADCLTSVLKAAKFPSPGSWPAKVTFPL